jgi:soluble lytic murein transglycosylase-like protein
MKYFYMLFLAATITVSTVEAKETHRKIVQKHVKLHEELTLSQKQILTSAFNTAKKEGNYNPLILPGIIFVESTAKGGPKVRSTKHKPVYDKSVGLAQIIAGTAESVIKDHPELKRHMKSKNLAHELAYNDTFNIMVANSYLSDLSQFTHSDAQLIAAYNTGHIVKKPERMGYVKKVQKSVSRMRKELT